MQMLRRHDKKNQQHILQARTEADQTLRELHRLLSGPTKSPVRVGDMITLAARMGQPKSPYARLR